MHRHRGPGLKGLQQRQWEEVQGRSRQEREGLGVSGGQAGSMGAIKGTPGIYLPAMQETQVQSLGWEDPLEKEMAAHSSTRASRLPWMEELGGLQSMGSETVRHD